MYFSEDKSSYWLVKLIPIAERLAEGLSLPVFTAVCRVWDSNTNLPLAGTTLYENIFEWDFKNTSIEESSTCCTYIWPIAFLAVQPSCLCRKFIWGWPLIFIISFTVISPFVVIDRFTSCGHQTLLYTVKKTDAAISIYRSTVQAVAILDSGVTML